LREGERGNGGMAAKHGQGVRKRPLKEMGASRGGENDKTGKEFGFRAF